MPAYDSARFDPPAPLARVTLRNPTTGATWSDVPMLLDSGADVTLVPHQSIQELDLATIPDRHYELLSFDGSTSIASAIRLELIFLDRTFRGQFLVIEQEWGIMGRNILNSVILLLDGPPLTWDEVVQRASHPSGAY